MRSALESIKCLVALPHVFLDTETTGLSDSAEICEIAIVSHDGQVLFESLVKPTHAIPSEAFRIHGISEKDVADAPSISQIWPQIESLLMNKTIICYNADYDSRLVRQSLNAHGYGETRLKWKQWQCAMELYSAYLGQERWVKLTTAIFNEGVRVDGKAHRAAYDAKCTHALMHHLAQNGEDRSDANWTPF